MEVIDIIFEGLVKVASTSTVLYNFAKLIAMVLWRKDCA